MTEDAISLAGSVRPIAVGRRSGFDESVHHGVAVAIGADGATLAAVGDPDVVVYPRSSLKPLQATAMVEAGLDLPADLLALACASHDGSQVHVEGVRRLLALHGLDESDLRNTSSRPYDPGARTAARLAGTGPSPLQHNCSGKHAAMLATCRVNGWSTDDYLHPEHPLQTHITCRIGALAGRVHHVGVDGCGAPAHAIGLRDLARGVASIVRAGSPVASAMSVEPDLVGGEHRDVSILMRSVPGLVLKDGAQGVAVGALADGSSFAAKIADGSDAARRVVMLEGLRWIGADVPSEIARTLAVPVLGHGEPVGVLRAVEWTPCAS